MAEALAPSEIVLRSVRLLRQPRAAVPEDVRRRRVLSKGYLRWLAGAFDASSIGIYLYGRKGVLTEILRVGTTIPNLSGATDLTLRQLKAATSPNLMIGELTDGYRWRRQLHPLFGFIIVYRERGFSSDENEALSDICGFIGGEIQHREATFASARARHARAGIQDVSRVGPFTGTRLATAVRHLCDGTGASYAGFGVVLGGRFLLLYRRQPHQRGNAKYMDNAPLVRISGALLTSSPLVEIQAITENHLSELAPVMGVPAHQVSDFLFSVAGIAHGGHAVAAFVLGVSRHTVEHDEAEAKALVRIAAETLEREIEITYEKISGLMIVDPIFRGRNIDVVQNHVFVLMPFTEAWSTRVWERLIRPVCQDEGYVARRADDLFGRDIVEDIWRSICDAAVIIADITGRNPNVFYELGVAHSVGKNVILITQDVKDIPFDLNRYRHIIYADNMDGYDKLRRELALTLREIASK